MRNFVYKVEQYEARSGKNTGWIFGNVFFYIPFVVILHLFVVFAILPGFKTDVYSICLYTYGIITPIIGLAALILIVRASIMGYRLISIFTVFNTIRCFTIAGVLTNSIYITSVNPPAPEIELHMPLAVIIIPCLFLIFIEIVEGFMHLGNMYYMRKRKDFFAMSRSN